MGRESPQRERGVLSRGDDARVAPIGTFEVDGNGRIVSEAPLPYRMN